MNKKIVTTLLISFIISNSIIVLADNTTDMSNDFDEWAQIADNGLGNKNNIAPRGVEIFQDKLIFGIGSYDSNNGTIMFDSPISIRDYLYEVLINGTFSYTNFYSDGCEIWSYNGTNFTQIIGEDGFLPAGFGNKNNIEIGFLIIFKNLLYAGIRNEIEGCQVWRTNNLENWEQVAENGFGYSNNSWAMTAAVFKDELYVGTFNIKQGCEIYKTDDGMNWTASVGGNSQTDSGYYTPENFYAWSMCVYDGFLYVGTDASNGCELWRTNDGIVWEPLIGYEGVLNAKIHGARYPRGFGYVYSIGPIRNMFVYKNELYMCMIGGHLYFDLVLERFGKLFTIAFQPQIMLRITQGKKAGSIFKYNSTTEKFTGVVNKHVIGKRNPKQFGFGDLKNIYLWSVEIVDDDIFIGTWNLDPIRWVIKRNNLFNWQLTLETPTGHAEIWKSNNGNVWNQSADKGFQGDYNTGVRILKQYKGDLYAFTFNMKTGCEIWRYTV